MSRFLPAVLLAASAALVPWCREAAAETPPGPDLAAILSRTRESQSRDLEAWRQFAFRRVVTRERLDAGGSVEDRDHWVFLVTPIGEGFDETLVRIDGRTPTEREIRHHRKKARFQEHYGAVRTGEEPPEDTNTFSFRRLLHMPAYTHEGIEEVDGIPCHRLDFEPVPEGEAGDLADRFSRSMGGSLWITEDGLHLYRASARTKRPISIGLGLAKVQEVKVEFRARPVEAGLWLPARIEVHSHGRILASAFHKHNIYLYEEYRRIEPSVP